MGASRPLARPRPLLKIGAAKGPLRYTQRFPGLNPCTASEGFTCTGVVYRVADPDVTGLPSPRSLTSLAGGRERPARLCILEIIPDRWKARPGDSWWLCGISGSAARTGIRPGCRTIRGPSSRCDRRRRRGRAVSPARLPPTTERPQHPGTRYANHLDTGTALLAASAYSRGSGHGLSSDRRSSSRSNKCHTYAEEPRSLCGCRPASAGSWR
jgi:hypothetical protein